MNKGIKPGKYKHYKGGLYRVIGVAMLEETGDKMVIYQALYDCPELEQEFGLRPNFVRPYSVFTEMVSVGKKQLPRFKFIKE